MFLIRIGRQRWTTIAENADGMHCYQEMRPDCVYSWIELFTRSVTFVPSFSCREEYFIFGVNAMVILKFLSPEAGLYYWNGPFSIGLVRSAKAKECSLYLCTVHPHKNSPSSAKSCATLSLLYFQYFHHIFLSSVRFLVIIFTLWDVTENSQTACCMKLCSYGFRV